jgi:hypothetical protein
MQHLLVNLQQQQLNLHWVLVKVQRKLFLLLQLMLPTQVAPHQRHH